MWPLLNLFHFVYAMQSKALLALCSLSTGNDAQTQSLVNAHVLSHFPALLQHQKKKKFQTNALQCLSNFADTEAQVQAVVDAGLVPLVVKQLAHGDVETQFEALWVVCNISSAANGHQLELLIDFGSFDNNIDYERRITWNTSKKYAKEPNAQVSKLITIQHVHEKA